MSAGAYLLRSHRPTYPKWMKRRRTREQPYGSSFTAVPSQDPGLAGPAPALPMPFWCPIRGFGPHGRADQPRQHPLVLLRPAPTDR